MIGAKKNCNLEKGILKIMKENNLNFSKKLKTNK